MRTLARRRSRVVSFLACLTICACSTPGGAPDTATGSVDAATSRDADAIDAFVTPNDGASLDSQPADDVPSTDACAACRDVGPAPCGAPASSCTLPGGSSGVCDDGHVCVGCLTNTECSGAGLHCDGRSHECVGEDVVLVTLRRGTTDVVGAQYTGAAWTAPAMVATAVQNIDFSVVVTGDRAGLATLMRNSMGAFAIDHALWRAGTWGAQTDSGFLSSRAGTPVPTSHGAALAFAPGPTPSVLVATFDAVTRTWSTDATTIQSTSSRQVRAGPAIAATSSGDLLVAYGGFVFASVSTTTYGFAHRTGLTWTADAPIPGATGPNPSGAIELARTGDDGIVAVWASSVTALSAATYRAGVWSAVTPVASDLISGSFHPINLVPLPDGRVALAYRSHAAGSPSIDVSVAFFDGAWSAPRTVPGATLSTVGSIPLGLARGANGTAVLELVYLEQTSNLARHVRLTTESSWTWTSPTMIDAMPAGCIALAVGP